MSAWPSAKARKVLAALHKIGWRIKRTSGSHKTLSRDGFPDYTFAFHDDDELGPKDPREDCEEDRIDSQRLIVERWTHPI